MSQGASHGAILRRVRLLVTLQLLPYLFEIHLIVDLVQLGGEQVLTSIELCAFDGDGSQQIECLDLDLGLEVVHHRKGRLQHLFEGVCDVALLVKPEKDVEDLLSNVGV